MELSLALDIPQLHSCLLELFLFLSLNSNLFLLLLLLLRQFLTSCLVTDILV